MSYIFVNFERAKKKRGGERMMICNCYNTSDKRKVLVSCLPSLNETINSSFINCSLIVFIH